MVKWSGSKRQRLTDRERETLVREEEAQREYRRRLQVIKDKLDLYGDLALGPEERAFIAQHPGFFYPEE